MKMIKLVFYCYKFLKNNFHLPWYVSIGILIKGDYLKTEF